MMARMAASPGQSVASLLSGLREQQDAMTAQLAELVEAETPSADRPACEAGAATVAAIAGSVLGEAGELVLAGGRPHLRWRWPAEPGRPPLVLIGHFDTVWPLGTLARWPFSVDAATGTATGPGCFDMKAGIVQLLHAVAALGDRAGIEILLTSDEEIGSPASRPLIEEAARRATAAMILEPSALGKVKTMRKGTGFYQLAVTGRAAHAGLEPEKGATALIALAELIGRLTAIARPELGTSVTPTVAAAGTAANVVPAGAHADIDVRVADPAEASRVDAELRALTTTVPGTRLTVSGGPNRPPMPRQATEALFGVARAAAADLGLPPLAGTAVGGGSDGNFTAAAGCPTLDGLGAVGDGAHAEGEYVLLAAMPERAALLAALIGRLRTGS
jgi:glutamate carboxypeptidase